MVNRVTQCYTRLIKLTEKVPAPRPHFTSFEGGKMLRGWGTKHRLPAARKANKLVRLRSGYRRHI
jgi:hypothetical protein